MPATANLPQTLSVLLVDDDSDTTVLWRTMLRRHAPDWNIVTVSDGEQALAMIRERRPDLVLMDIVLPGLDGLAVTQTLKADPRTARIPIIAVTGVLFSSQRVLDAGCDGYLLKPVTEIALLESIRRALRIS